LFNSGAPVVMCGYDVTRRILFTKEHMRLLYETKDKLNIAMADMMKRWFGWWKRDFTAMNDPLCVALAFDPSFCRGANMNVTVEYDHRHPTGRTVCTLPRTPWTPPELLDAEFPEPSVFVCLDVDSERFIKLLTDRVIDRRTYA